MTTPPAPGGSKDDWRSWAKGVRAGLDFHSLAGPVLEGLESWSMLSGKVLVYLPLPDEVDLTALRSTADLAVTRTPPEGPLTVHPFASERERHRYGFEQPIASSPLIDPKDIEVALVPGMAFDRSGTRLGRGAGYYDELLRALAPPALTVGIVPEALLVDELPRDGHDAPMTHLATESGVTEVDQDLPAASRRVADAARGRGVFVKVRRFPEGTKTSQEAAAAIGCEVSAIVKSLVFMVDGEAVVALLPGDLRLDPAKLAKAHGGAGAKRAGLEEVREATGYAAGGTPPFGHTARLAVYADPGLRRHRWVWAAAGTPTSVFPIGLDDLIELSGGRWTDLAQA